MVGSRYENTTLHSNVLCFGLHLAVAAEMHSYTHQENWTPICPTIDDTIAKALFAFKKTKRGNFYTTLQFVALLTSTLVLLSSIDGKPEWTLRFRWVLQTFCTLTHHTTLLVRGFVFGWASASLSDPTPFFACDKTAKNSRERLRHLGHSLRERFWSVQHLLLLVLKYQLVKFQTSLQCAVFVTHDWVSLRKAGCRHFLVLLARCREYLARPARENQTIYWTPDLLRWFVHRRTKTTKTS